MVMVVRVDNVVLSVVTHLNGWLGGRLWSFVDVFMFMIVIFWLVVDLWFMNAAIVVAVEDVSSVWKLSAIAGQDISTGTNHVWSEGELLAVEHEEVSVNIKSFLAVSALPLESVNSILLVIDFMVIV